MQLFRKILSGMANSVNPDRTLKEQSDLSLHCSYMPFCQKHWCTIFGPLPPKKKKKKKKNLELTKAGLTSGLVLISYGLRSRILLHILIY